MGDFLGIYSGFKVVLKNKVKIRKFNLEDSLRCSEIILGCIREAKKISSKDRKFLKDFYSAENISKISRNSDFYVAEVCGNVIGTGRLEGNKIATVYFDYKFRKKGGGSLMLKRLENLARKRGIRKIKLDALIQAKGFYEKLGYKRIGELDKPVRAILMEKYLN